MRQSCSSPLWREAAEKISEEPSFIHSTPLTAVHSHGVSSIEAPSCTGTPNTANSVSLFLLAPTAINLPSGDQDMPDKENLSGYDREVISTSEDPSTLAMINAS